MPYKRKKECKLNNNVKDHKKLFKTINPFQKEDFLLKEYRIKSHFFKYINYFVSTLLFVSTKINWSEIDVIIGYEDFGARIGKLYASLFRKPFIVKYQGSLRYFHFFDENYSKKNIYFMKYLMRVNADKIIITNDGTFGDLLLMKMGFPKEKILYIKNGYSKEFVESYINTKNIDETLKKYDLNRNDKIVLSVSRLDPWKRNDRIILSLKNMLRQDKIKLLVIGDGESREYLEYLVNKNNINKNVIFTGALDHNEIIKVFKISFILVQYYDYSNLSNPVMEAFSINKPIITLDDGSTDDFLIKGYNCIKIRLEDIMRETEEAVKYLLIKENYERIVDNCVKSKHLLNTWEERFEKELEIIRDLIK